MTNDDVLSGGVATQRRRSCFSLDFNEPSEKKSRKSPGKNDFEILVSPCFCRINVVMISRQHEPKDADVTTYRVVF